MQAMLHQYSGRDKEMHKLDDALQDAVQMVRVSDERISYLRKMHALLLLKRCVLRLAYLQGFPAQVCYFSQCEHYVAMSHAAMEKMPQSYLVLLGLIAFRYKLCRVKGALDTYQDDDEGTSSPRRATEVGLDVC